MKKILGMLSVAAMMLVACDEENGGNGQDPADTSYTKPRVEAPANQADHFGLTVDQSRPQDGMKTPEGQVAKTTEVNVPPGNTGTVQFNDGRAPRDFNYTVSKVAGGVTFLCDEVFKQLQLSSVDDDGNVVLIATTMDNKNVTLNGTLIEEPAYTPYRQDVCRTWEVEETLLAITVDGKSILGVGGRFEGCKLSKISDKLVEKGVNITPLSPAYDVKKIMIDPCGKFGIFFEGRDAYYGDYTLKGTSFEYNFQYYEENDDNPVIAGSATGKLWAIGGYGRLNLNSDMKDASGKKYTVDITLKMKTAK